MDEIDIIEENEQLHAEITELRAKLKMPPRQGTPAAAEKPSVSKGATNTLSRSEFDTLSQTDRREFFAKGGKVI